MDVEVAAGGVIPHRTSAGNWPNDTFLHERLTPHNSGALVYEHRVFVQAAIGGIDAFDQRVVELGKVLAKCAAAELVSPQLPDLRHDSSTSALIRRYREQRGLP